MNNRDRHRVKLKTLFLMLVGATILIVFILYTEVYIFPNRTNV